jgi:hypothetical protein
MCQSVQIQVSPGKLSVLTSIRTLHEQVFARSRAARSIRYTRLLHSIAVLTVGGTEWTLETNELIEKFKATTDQVGQSTLRAPWASQHYAAACLLSCLLCRRLARTYLCVSGSCFLGRLIHARYLA